MSQPQGPQLSVVVVMVGDTVTHNGDTSDLAGNLGALTRQIAPQQMEVIVPYHAGIAGIEDAKRQFPNIVFLFVEHLKGITGRGRSREHHDELRAWGTVAARGEIVAFLEDHVRPAPDWSAQVIEAHRQDFAAIGGAIQNGINRPLNWAAYFCDLGKYQNPLPAGGSSYASTVNVSYKRAALESIRSTWEDTFNETRVNGALNAKGQKLGLSPAIVVYQHRHALRLGTALQEFYIWGRSYAHTRNEVIDRGRRGIYAVLASLLPGLLLVRMAVNVVKKRRTVNPFVRALPLTALLSVSWSLGEMVGYLRSGPKTTGSSERQPWTARGVEIK